MLVALAALGESYPREIAALLDVPLLSVQRIFNDLEDQGLIVSRVRGRIRLTTISKTSPLGLELTTLLFKMLEFDPALFSRLATVRRRPRAAGKII